MALEPAGVSLEAQGFSDYIKKLDAIEKKNRQVFDTQFKGTDKSFTQVTAAAKKYEKELKDLASAERKAALEAQKLAAAEKTAAATRRQAFISTTQAVGSLIKQVAQATFEVGKLGAQFQGQQIGLNNLAGSFGQAGSEIQKAIQDASKGTLSGLQAIQAANQGLLLGVAQTPEEFANLTNSALTLGRTLGLDATQSIEQFTSALGRQSLLILDNFGISAKQVNAEIERLAQADFGKARSELTEAQKQATFMKAALNIAGEAAATIGDEAGEAQASFDRLTAQASDFKVELGIAVSNLNQSLGITEKLSSLLAESGKGIKIFSAGLEGATLEQQIEATEIKIESLSETIEKTKDALPAFLEVFSVPLQEKELASLQQQLEELNLEKVAQDQEKVKDEFEDTPPVIEDNTEAIKSYENALKQAQSLQLSFAREGEDAARKLARANEDLAIKQARANEDVARRQAKSIVQLEKSQKDDRDKLLSDQIKQRAKFEADSKKQIAKAEEEISKERRKAGEERKRDQRKLQQDLLRAQEQFNLSQLQSRRRFDLQESRLRAEGDILGLKELREDFALSQQEAKENFDLSKKEQVKSGREQLKEQERVDNDRVKELKSSLEERRAELLASFDEQLAEQVRAQAQARAEQQRAFAEEAIEREIALQRQEEDRTRALEREEEDRRISQRRQLEDLGIALAEQKEVTAQGVNAIAEEIEKVFGIDGTATNIIAGFSKQSRSEFETLFEEVEDIVKKAEGIEPRRDTPLVALTGDTRRGGGGGFGERRTAGGIQAFNDGGVVPGPVGAPVPAIVHGGETVLPTHRQSFQMAAPIIPSQNLNVNMSGGFNVSGDGQGDERILQAASQEMVENFRIAVTRIARRN